MRSLAVAPLVVAAAAFAASACASDESDAGSFVPGSPAAVWAAACASCHGQELEGTATGPSLRYEVFGPDQLTDEQIVEVVRTGVPVAKYGFGPMAGLPALSEADVSAAVEHLRAQQALEPLLPGTPPGP